MIVAGSTNIMKVYFALFLFSFSPLVCQTSVKLEADLGLVHFNKWDIQGYAISNAISFQPKDWFSLSTSFAIADASEYLFQQTSSAGIQIDYNAISQTFWIIPINFHNSSLSFGIGGLFTYTSLINGEPKKVIIEVGGNQTEVTLYENIRVSYLTTNYLLSVKYEYLFKDQTYLGLRYQYSGFEGLNIFSVLVAKKLGK